MRSLRLRVAALPSAASAVRRAFGEAGAAPVASLGRDDPPDSPLPLAGARGGRLGVTRPDLLREWCAEKNAAAGVASGASVPSTSEFDAFWRCHGCRRDFRARVVDRANGTAGCPECRRRAALGAAFGAAFSAGDSAAASAGAGGSNAGSAASPAFRSLAESHPGVAALWASDANGLLLPTDVSADTAAEAWWRPSPATAAAAAAASGVPLAVASAPFRRSVAAHARDAAFSPIGRGAAVVAGRNAALQALGVPAFALPLATVSENGNAQISEAAGSFGSFGDSGAFLSAADAAALRSAWRGAHAARPGAHRDHPPTVFYASDAGADASAAPSVAGSDAEITAAALRGVFSQRAHRCAILASASSGPQRRGETTDVSLRRRQ